MHLNANQDGVHSPQNIVFRQESQSQSLITHDLNTKADKIKGNSSFLIIAFKICI